MRYSPAFRVCVLLALGTVATAASAAPGWREDATWLFATQNTHETWAQPGGDVAAVLGTATLTAPGKISFPTSANGDVLVRGTGDAAFGTREGALGPVCTSTAGVVSGALADVGLDPTSYRSLGTMPVMHSRGGFLVRCPSAGTVELTATRVYSAIVALSAWTPAPRTADVVIPPVNVDPAVVLDFRAKDFNLRRIWCSIERKDAQHRCPVNKVVNADGTITAELSGVDLAWSEDMRSLPPAEEYFLTVVLKPGADFPDVGGKLPGLANTGIAHGARDCVTEDGKVHVYAGFGGRLANGCRWSARSGWRGRTEGGVGRGTYFYALQPKDVNGIMDFISPPIPVARWSAYIQHVRVNTPGKADGVLDYWAIDPVGGVHPAYHRGDIIYRSSGVELSKITELWADTYCGGRNCGFEPWPRSTISFKRLTVTKGLPDLGAISAEVAALNGASR